jgi:hypothetical protein
MLKDTTLIWNVGSIGSWWLCRLGNQVAGCAKRIAANRAHLFVFVTNRDVPHTDNNLNDTFVPASFFVR